MDPKGSLVNGKATIKDVARLSGVSTQTVSRVLNKRPDVSPETRQRVLDIINQLGYQPSALARSLIHQRSYSIGVITAGLKYAGISQTLNGITEQAEACGYSLLLKELSAFDVVDVQPEIRSLIAHQVEAIIYAVPEYGENWRNAQQQCPSPCPPVVFLKGRPQLSHPTISIDNFSGAYLATRHLIDQGCRNIAHITGPLEWWEARERTRGWKTALEESGLSIKENQYVVGNWSSASGEKAFISLLENYPQADGVFAANDQMALAVLHVADARGINVPKQLAVVGFDDLAESPYFGPGLTTIRQDLRTLGILAVKKVLQMVNGQTDPDDEILADTLILQPQLIIRRSSQFGQIF